MSVERAATSYSRRFGLAGIPQSISGQWRRPEVHREALAPDRYSPVLRQIDRGIDLVILVADVPFERSEVNKSCLPRRRVVIDIIRSNKVDTHVGTVGRHEFGEPEHDAAVGQAVNGRAPFCLMRVAVKRA